MVPNGWIHTTFEKHIDLLGGFAFKSAQYSTGASDIKLLRGDNIEPGSLRWRGAKLWPQTEAEGLEKYYLKEHDFVIAMDRTWVSAGLKVAEVKEIDLPCLLVQRVSRIRTLPTLEQSLLKQYFSGHRFEQYVKSVQTETAVPHISSKQIKEFSFLLPPLPIQRKIAKILSTWDKAISTTERLIDNNKQQKKALMQQLLTGKKRLLDDSGKPFEGEWEEITLERLAKYRRGSFPQPYGNPEWVDEVNGYPFIQVYDIDKNMKLKPDTKIKISDAAIGKSVFIPKETVIVSLQGSIGRVAITQYDAYVDRTVLLFQEFIVPMEKVFFAFIIQELFEIEKTKAPGGTIKTITKEVLSNFKVHIPSITEQQKIASVLINADQEIELLEQQLVDLKQEKKALMQQLLTGKRRVKTDDKEVA
jgi:type I restriction enzyme S subunit